MEFLCRNIASAGANPRGFSNHTLRSNHAATEECGACRSSPDLAGSWPELEDVNGTFPRNYNFGYVINAILFHKVGPSPKLQAVVMLSGKR